MRYQVIVKSSSDLFGAFTLAREESMRRSFAYTYLDGVVCSRDGHDTFIDASVKIFDELVSCACGDRLAIISVSQPSDTCMQPSTSKTYAHRFQPLQIV